MSCSIKNDASELGLYTWDNHEYISPILHMKVMICACALNKRGQDIRDAAFLIISGGKVKSRTAEQQDDKEVLAETPCMLYHRVIIKRTS